MRNKCILYFVYCLFSLLSFAAKSDSTVDIGSSISLDELISRGALVNKKGVSESDPTYLTVRLNLKGLRHCQVEGVGVHVYDGKREHNIMAYIPVALVNGEYEFFARSSYLPNMSVSIGCNEDGFFRYIDASLE